MKTGTPLPSVPVQQFVDGDIRQIDLAALSKGKTIVLVGVPGAFTLPCSELHMPGYLQNAQAFAQAGVDAIVVLAASDFFVVKAWAEQLQPDPIFEFVADGSLRFTAAAGMEVDFNELGLGIRTQRYAALVRDGVVQNLFVEPDATAVTISSAENMLLTLQP